MNDDTLALAVEAALQQTGYFRPGQIGVSVSHGMVVLQGEIEWDFQKRTALFAVKALPGLAGIIDNIILRFSQPTLASLHIHQYTHARPGALSVLG